MPASRGEVRPSFRPGDDGLDRLIEVLWHSSQLNSSEHFTLARRNSGHRLSGVVIVPIEGQPGDLRYAVDVDEQWRTLSADIDVFSGGQERRIDIVADRNGRWRVSGETIADLQGCLDVDLGWTPSTNTLAIRRLGLDVGEVASIEVALVRFPELTVERATQTYERLHVSRWRYSSGSFTADLEVDPNGVVHRYGPDIWTAIAHA